MKSFCDSQGVDLVYMAFVSDWGNKKQLTASFGPQCYVANGVGGDGCSSTLGPQIKYCQSKGVKVLVSLGGSTGAAPPYTLADQEDGEDLAQQLYDLFGGGSKNVFGGVAVDGFDWDVEGSSGAENYQYANTKIKELMSDSIASATPQCFYPDANLGDMIKNSAFDIINVQFYNTWSCSAALEIQTPGVMPYDKWPTSLASTKSSGAQIFLGLVAKGGADAKFTISAADSATIVNKFKGKPQYGGVMTWDGDASLNQMEGGCSYTQNIASILKSGSPCSGGSGDGSSSSSGASTSSGSDNTATGASDASTDDSDIEDSDADFFSDTDM